MKKSRKKRLGTPTLPAPDPIAMADSMVRQMARMLEHGSRFCGEEWLLLAVNAVEADKAIREAGDGAPLDLRLRFEAAIEGLREETSNFQNVYFLRSSSAARRKNMWLFTP
jgi:hypothetical protein